MWFTVTTLVSTNKPEFAHHAAETWERWNFVSKIILMTLLMLPIVNTYERLRYLVLTIAGCFAFYILKSFPFIIATGGSYKLYGPARSMIADNTDFGLALNMTLPLYFFLAQSESKRWTRLACWFMFLITIPAIFFTYSRGALIGLATVFFIMMLQSKRRLSLVPVACTGRGGGAVVCPRRVARPNGFHQGGRDRQLGAGQTQCLGLRAGTRR